MFSRSTTRPNCVFCDIASGHSSGKKRRRPDRILFRNELFYVLADIAPATDTHLLAIPVRHISNANALQADDVPLVLQMQAKLRELLTASGYDVDSPDVSIGFHLPPFISVKHLHLHALAPVAKFGFVGRFKFVQNNRTYCTVQYALDKIMDRQKKRVTA